MASGLFALLDDIATLMHDVAAMSKVAAKKTAGILGDDLAVNAEKASGFVSDRELPVLWAVTKGSALNKLIILPFAFLLSAFIPHLIVPILLIGGVYLSFEGVEKIIHTFFYKERHRINFNEVKTDNELLKVEKAKGSFEFTLPTDAKTGSYRVTYDLQNNGYVDFLFNKEISSKLMLIKQSIFLKD